MLGFTRRVVEIDLDDCKKRVIATIFSTEKHVLVSMMPNKSTSRCLRYINNSHLVLLIVFKEFFIFHKWRKVEYLQIEF